MSKPPPLGLRWRSSTTFIVATVGIAMFTDLFLYGIIVPILPYLLADRIELPHQQLQSHISVLLAINAFATVAFCPVASVIADRSKSKKTAFLLGLLALLAATLLFFLGRSFAVLAVARALQGMSVAVVWPIGLALLLETVGPERLGTTMGSVIGLTSIGQFLGPLLGGIVQSKGGYSGVLALAFAPLAVDIIMRILMIEKKTVRRNRWFQESDNQGVEDPESGSNPHNDPQPSEEDPLVKKQISLRYRLPDVRRSKIVRAYPLLSIWKNPRLLTALWMNLVESTIMSSFDATIFVVAQDYFGFNSALKSSLLYLAVILPYFTFGIIFGRIVDKVGPRPVAVYGIACVPVTLFALRFTQPGGEKQLIIYCVILALNGCFMACFASPSLVEASSVVELYSKANPDLFGEEGPWAQLYGLQYMVFSTGLTLGPLVSGGLKAVIGYGNMNLFVRIELSNLMHAG